jgi:hypothetical protein
MLLAVSRGHVIETTSYFIFQSVDAIHSYYFIDVHDRIIYAFQNSHRTVCRVKVA